eukprot:6182963-Pleurochrysis_carterae.AAC.1
MCLLGTCLKRGENYTYRSDFVVLRCCHTPSQSKKRVFLLETARVRDALLHSAHAETLGSKLKPRAVLKRERQTQTLHADACMRPPRCMHEAFSRRRAKHSTQRTQKYDKRARKHQPATYSEADAGDEATSTASWTQHHLQAFKLGSPLETKISLPTPRLPRCSIMVIYTTAICLSPT